MGGGEVVTIGKAIAIFHEIYSDQYTELEKAEAIYRVMHMETHNSIRKEAMLKVIGYLWDLRYEFEVCE